MGILKTENFRGYVSSDYHCIGTTVRLRDINIEATVKSAKQ